MKNRSKIWILILTLSITFAVMLKSGLVYADSPKLESDDEENVIQLHQEVDSVLHLDNGWLYQDAIRSVGWFFIKGQIWVVDYIEDGVNGMLQWNNFYDSFGIGKLIKELTPFALGLFLISLIYLGFQFMTNKIEKREEVLMNVLMAFGFIFLIPVLMPYIDKVMKVGIDQLQSEDQLRLSESIIKQNVADVKYYVDSNFDFDRLGLPLDKTVAKGEKVGSMDYTTANKITDAWDVSITEKLDLQSEESWFGWWSTGYKNELKTNNKLGHDVLLTQLVPTGDGGKKLKELAKNKIPTTSLGQESYYRYHINWWTVIFSLGVISIALAITVVKIGRIIFDLAFHAIFGMFVSATDLTGGQRTKKVVTEIVSSFSVLFVMMLILKIFSLYVNWVVGLTSTVGGIIAVLMLIAGAWALIDAPDIVQRVLGIDAGLRSGWQAMMGAYAGAKMTGGLAKGAGNAVSGASKLAKGGLAYGKGLSGMSPIKKGAQGVKPMPSSKGFTDGKQGGSNANGNENTPEMAQSFNGSSDPNQPSTTNLDGSQRTEKEGIKPMPSSNKFISPSNNPYQSNRHGLRSGSAKGQQSADLKARAYNSGVGARQALTGAGKAVGSVAMAGARIATSPIQSTKNVGSMAMNQASNTMGSIGKKVQMLPSSVGNNIGNVVSQMKQPTGSSVSGSTPKPISLSGQSGNSRPNIQEKQLAKFPKNVKNSIKDNGIKRSGLKGSMNINKDKK